MKTVHSFDYTTGIYLGPVVLGNSDMSPLEPGVYLIPGNCVEAAPPAVAEGQFVAFHNGQWAVKDMPKPLPATTPEPLTGNAFVIAQIAALEATITPRRMREYMFGTDGGWLKGVETKMAALRLKVVK